MAVPLAGALGACGDGGGIFHDLYCVWGGSDTIVPIDVYIPNCPPPPAATLYGFAVALGLLEQKRHGVSTEQGEHEQAALLLPDALLDLRVQLEREARRMADYRQGREISDAFINLLLQSPQEMLAARVNAYLAHQDDPRLSEIVQRLLAQYHGW